MDAQGVSPDTGTIIVTYQTDLTASETSEQINPARKRFDRIRFWLINDQEERTLYPKKDEFVSNRHAPNERTVVITHLPVGDYRIEFLIPNTDQIFEDPPVRHATLSAGGVVKIDQAIRQAILAS